VQLISQRHPNQKEQLSGILDLEKESHSSLANCSIRRRIRKNLKHGS
jgi:hypothetical protein